MSLYLKHKFDEGLKIFGLWYISESEEELKSLFYKVGYGPKTCNMERYYNINNQKRRIEWLSTRILIYQIFNEPKKIDYTENGKPYLIDNDFHISISHSCDFVAVLLSYEGRAGLDIERVSERVQKISHKFLNAQEAEHAPVSDQYAITLFWGAKEALYKLHGNENINLRDNINIKPFEPRKIGILEGVILNGHHPEEHILHYFFFSDYLAIWTD